MISVEALSKKFADAEAVRAITFQVEKGEILGLLGRNGAGKTTTMRMLTCFVTPTSGTATVAGYDIYDQQLEVRRNIGYLPESVPMYGEMRVEEYLRFRARLKGVSRASVGSRLDYVVDRCGLGEVRAKVIDHLSKGYRQRVGLADALVHNPPILILDEPTVGLDPNQIRQVRELILDLGREHTIILSSHILGEVEQVCGRIVIIHRGRIVVQERTETLRRDRGGAEHLEVEVLGNRASVLEALAGLPGVLAVRETSREANLQAQPPVLAAAARSSDPARADAQNAAFADAARAAFSEPGGAVSASTDGSATAHPFAGGAGRSTPGANESGGVRATLECAPKRDLREEVFRLAVARGWVLLGLTRTRLSLEDIFVNLTTEEPAHAAAPAAPPPEALGVDGATGVGASGRGTDEGLPSEAGAPDDPRGTP